MNTKDQAIFDAVNKLQVASHILENLRALFVAIGKMSNQEVSSLSSIGQMIAEEWSGDIGDYAEQLFALRKSSQVVGGEQ